MSIRRLTFWTSLILSIFLFVQGIYTLNSFNSHEIQYYAESTPLKKVNYMPSVTGIDQSTNLLLLGLDDEELRSDVIALINFNPTKKKINILSIARDTRVKANGKYGKINALVSKGGEELVISEVEKITGLKVDYFMTLNFKGFREIVDIVGGVELNVPMDMDYDDPIQGLHIHLKKGKQVLDGRKSEQFVRYRKGNHRGEGYEDGDIGRIEAQQLFFKEFINQKLKAKYILKAGSIFSVLKENMRTNIEIDDIEFFVRQVNNIKVNEIKTFTLPGESVYKNGVWYYIYNEKKSSKIIEDNFINK